MSYSCLDSPAGKAESSEIMSSLLAQECQVGKRLPLLGQEDIIVVSRIFEI